MTVFCMTLSPNDVNGVRQEGYVLIPLRARDAQPSFWSWPGRYAPLATGQLEFPIRLDDLGQPGSSRIYFVPERAEFRLCAERVYRLGAATAGAVLEVERTGVGAYRTEVHPVGSPTFAAYAPSLTNSVANSAKRWGYV